MWLLTVTLDLGSLARVCGQQRCFPNTSDGEVSAKEPASNDTARRAERNENSHDDRTSNSDAMMTPIKV